MPEKITLESVARMSHHEFTEARKEMRNGFESTNETLRILTHDYYYVMIYRHHKVWSFTTLN